MENGTGEGSMLDIHIFEFEIIFQLQKLIKKHFFKINSFDVKQDDHDIVVSLVAHVMVAVSTHVINVNFLLDHVFGSTHFGD
jgi:hypothetical protein